MEKSCKILNVILILILLGIFFRFLGGQSLQSQQHAKAHEYSFSARPARFNVPSTWRPSTARVTSTRHDAGNAASNGCR